VRIRLGHIAGGVDHAVQHTDHAQPPRCRIHSHPHGVEQVLRAVGVQRGGWPHGSGQDHRLVGVQHQAQKVSGFFQRIGAVGDDAGLNLRLRQPEGHAFGQLRPDREGHVLTVEIGHLLGVDLSQAAERRHALQQRVDPQNPGGVTRQTGVARRGARDRAPCSQHHNLRQGRARKRIGHV
jgi:hypothetical protein